MNRKFIFIFLLVLIPVVSAGYMFSTYSANDTHIGQPGFFSNNITYDGTFNLTNESCGLQDFVIGMKSQNDSHISGNPNFYLWRLCSNDTECEVTTTCFYDSVGSLYQMNDSHWGAVDYFNFTLCCERVGRDGGGANLTVSVGIVEEIIEEEEFIDVVKELIEGNAFLFVMVLAIIVILIILFLCWFLFILLTRRRKKEEKN